MALSDVVRSAVATAHKVTKDGGLQETVRLYRWNGQDDTGAPEYANALTVTAIVNHAGKRVRTAAGEEVVSTAQVIFLKPIPALSAASAEREEPIDKRDKIVLANGRTGPILRTDGGLADPDTDDGYLTQVWLG